MASTRLTKVYGSSGNRRTYTLSAWVKRSGLGSNQDIISAYRSTDGLQTDVMRWTSANKFQFYMHATSGGTNAQLTTDRVFRDTNAWYHIVTRVDTTQSTASNRVRIYINGVQETSFSTETYPDQNEQSIWGLGDSNVTHTIGAVGTSNYLDGYLSHVHYADGYSYDASTFGETDSTTGEWQIITSPSFTLGTNGFTILKDGNTVTDQSTNSNDFSVASGTLTKSEDNPSSIFCTANPLSKGSDTVLTNGNNTARNDTSNNSNTLGTIAFGNGKYYFEGYRYGGGNIGIGVCLASKYGGVHSEVEAGRVLYYENGSIFCNGLSDQSNITTGVTYSDTDIISVSMDTENGILKFYKNDTLVTNSTITNSKFTNAENIWVPHTYQNNGGEWRLNFGNGYFGTTAVSSAGTNASNNGIFEYDVKPSDATALSTKGLNL